MPRQRESEIGTLTAIAPAAPPPESKYERLIAKAKQVAPAQTIVVHPCDEGSLRGPVEAAELGIIKPILVGPAAKIEKVASEHGIEIGGFQVVDGSGRYDDHVESLAAFNALRQRPDGVVLDHEFMAALLTSVPLTPVAGPRSR